MNFRYTFRNGKNNKIAYYAAQYLSLMMPNFVYRARRRRLMSKFDKMSQSEKDIILDRVDYYCKLQNIEPLPESEKVKSLAEHKLSNREKRGYASVYFFDTFKFVRSYPTHLKWAYRFGDLNRVVPLPSITKSRPIEGDNQNNVTLKLNKVRHFIEVDDDKSWGEKSKISVFRGDIRRKKGRVEFVRLFHNSAICDAGDVCFRPDFPVEWNKPKLTLPEQLDYKFIVALEGNDVASNLKWVMSSNSVAIMPRPKCETWFMEGRLIPNVHYVEVAADFSDFEERVQYYLDHPKEAQQIVENAHKHWEQFKDPEREDIISYLVYDKYFRMTAQSK